MHVNKILHRFKLQRQKGVVSQKKCYSTFSGNQQETLRKLFMKTSLIVINPGTYLVWH